MKAICVCSAALLFAGVLVQSAESYPRGYIDSTWRENYATKVVAACAHPGPLHIVAGFIRSNEPARARMRWNAYLDSGACSWKEITFRVVRAVTVFTVSSGERIGILKIMTLDGEVLYALSTGAAR